LRAARETRCAIELRKRTETEKAAQKGDSNAQYAFGEMCGYGTNGVSLDCNEALKWFHKSAKQGFAQAQEKLGIMYFTGKQVPCDYNEALKWFSKAAKQGLSQSQAKLGAMYANGFGVNQDYKEAYKWSFLAASQGNKNAIKYKDYLKEKLSPEERVGAEKIANEFKSTASAAKVSAVKEAQSINDPNKSDLERPKIKSQTQMGKDVVLMDGSNLK
jgi:TPR repeat protein